MSERAPERATETPGRAPAPAGPGALRWLVTAGPTCEDIDPVRFISNRSSGRMGYALARAASERGDRATLVSGPVSLEAPSGVELVRVRSAREMREALVARFAEVDVLVMAAAVADFRPRRYSPTKLRRGGGALALELEPTEDILAELGSRKRGQVLVGFALEATADAGPGITEAMREGARLKLVEKHLDLVALNGPGAIGSEESELAVLDSRGQWRDWGRSSKETHARRLVELAAEIAISRRTGQR